MSDYQTPTRPPDYTGAQTNWCEHCGWMFPWHICPAIEMTADEEVEALAELETVSSAKPATLVYPTGAPDSHSGWYSGTFHWTTGNGWSVRVFNDCGEWDYIEQLIAPDGRSWEFHFKGERSYPWRSLSQRLDQWKPTDESGWPGIDSCPP